MLVFIETNIINEMDIQRKVLMAISFWLWKSILGLTDGLLRVMALSPLWVVHSVSLPVYMRAVSILPQLQILITDFCTAMFADERH